MHIGQAEVSSSVPVGEPCMVDPHQVQDRGVEIMHIHFVAHDRFADVVGFAMYDSPFDSSASQPDRKTVSMMAAAVVTLFVGSAAEFGGPHDECFVQHAALLQIP